MRTGSKRTTAMTTKAKAGKASSAMSGTPVRMQTPMAKDMNRLDMTMVKLTTRNEEVGAGMEMMSEMEMTDRAITGKKTAMGKAE
jgi:hypothetical protein